LELLFGENNEGTRDFDRCIETIATRLSTVFASMKEFPYVRYRAARSAAMDSTSTTTGRDLVPTKVAASLWDRLMKYKANLLNFPQVETCDLIIVDRSIDPVCTNHILVLWNVLSFQASRMDSKKVTKFGLFSV
jgi:syntaxin-binding protein 1